MQVCCAGGCCMQSCPGLLNSSCASSHVPACTAYFIKV
jgi:hypothetical protein